MTKTELELKVATLESAIKALREQHAREMQGLASDLENSMRNIERKYTDAIKRIADLTRNRDMVIAAVRNTLSPVAAQLDTMRTLLQDFGNM